MFSFNNILILATVLISIPAFGSSERMSKLVFNPYVVRLRNEWYRVVTHGFIHVGWGHLLVNMFVLFFFGRNMEHILMSHFGEIGRVFFLILYFGGMIFATLPAFKKHSSNPNYNSVGASGAVSAVLFAHILVLPTEMLYLYFAIPVPSFIFGIAYLWYEAWMDKKSADNIAHDAHFWGAIFGVAFMVAVDYNYFIQFFVQISQWISNLF